MREFVWHCNEIEAQADAGAVPAPGVPLDAVHDPHDPAAAPEADAPGEDADGGDQ